MQQGKIQTFQNRLMLTAVHHIIRVHNFPICIANMFLKVLPGKDKSNKLIIQNDSEHRILLVKLTDNFLLRII